MKFFKRRDQLCALPLNGSAKALMFRLHDYSGRQNQAYPGQERLAFDLYLDVRQIRRLLGEVEALGFVVGTARGQETTVYELKWDAIAAAGRTRMSGPNSAADRTPKSARQRTPKSAQKPRPDADVRPSNPDRTNPVVLTGHPCPPERKENSTSVIKTTKTDRTSSPGQHSPFQLKAPVIDAGRFASLDAGLQFVDDLIRLERIDPKDRLDALAVWHRIGRQYAEPDHAGIESPSAVCLTPDLTRSTL